MFVYGTRPFTGGMNEGVERALATMRAGERGLGEEWVVGRARFCSSGTICRNVWRS